MLSKETIVLILTIQALSHETQRDFADLQQKLQSLRDMEMPSDTLYQKMVNLANYLARIILRKIPSNLCTIIDGKKYIDCSWAKMNIAMAYCTSQFMQKSPHASYLQSYAYLIRQSAGRVSPHMKQHVNNVWKSYDSVLPELHAAHALIQLSSQNQNTACALDVIPETQFH